MMGAVGWRAPPGAPAPAGGGMGADIRLAGEFTPYVWLEGYGRRGPGQYVVQYGSVCTSSSSSEAAE